MNWLTKISSSGILTMYHATVAGTKIVQDGFKSREQIGGKAALGGGTDNSISFTTDWAVAKGVFDGFILIWSLTNATDQLGAVRNHFNALPKNKQKELVSMHKGGHGRNLVLDLSGYKHGGFFSWNNKKKPMTAEELKANGFLPWIDEEGKEEEPVDGRYYNWREPETIDDIYQFIYDYVKSYLASDPDVYDPVFFGASAKSFLGIKREDIGIITANVEIDPEKQRVDDYAREGQHSTYRNVGSMAEVRVYDLSTIKQVLFFDSNPGDTPPVSSKQQYYHTNDAVEYAVDMSIKVLKKYYAQLKPILAKHNIAIDGAISVLQQSNDMYQVGRAISQILKQINADYPASFENLYRTYSQSRIPSKVENALNMMPIEYRNRIENGEKIDDVVSDWYTNNKNQYYQWIESTGDIEREIGDWQYHYKYKKQMYEKALSEAQYMLGEKYTPDQLHMMAEVVAVLNKARNIDREYKKRVANKMNWLQKIAANFKKISSLNGEWFIDDSGYAQFADGDVGDMNHEMAAFQSKVPEELFEKYEKGTLTPEERFDIGEDFLQHMEHGGEAREWMVTHEGWIRVHGNNFELWKLDESLLSNIVNFLGEELQSEDEEELAEEEIFIDELSTGKLYTFYVQQLFNAQDSGSLGNFLLRFQAPTADASVEKVERLQQEKQNQLMNEGMNLIQEIKAKVGPEKFKQLSQVLNGKTTEEQVVLLRQMRNNPNLVQSTSLV